jgi:hypothetical protein
VEGPAVPWMSLVLGLGSDVLHKFCVEDSVISQVRDNWKSARDSCPPTLRGIMMTQTLTSLRRCRPADALVSSYLANAQGVFGLCVGVELHVFGTQELHDVWEALEETSWVGPADGFPWMGKSYRTTDDFLFSTGYDACPLLILPLENTPTWKGSPEMTLSRVSTGLRMIGTSPATQVRVQVHYLQVALLSSSLICKVLHMLICFSAEIILVHRLCPARRPWRCGPSRHVGFGPHFFGGAVENGLQGIGVRGVAFSIS